MTRELWKSVLQAPGYDISNLGRVRTRKPYRRFAPIPEEPRIVRQKINEDGYYIIGLYLGNRKYFGGLVSRMMLRVWRPLENLDGSLKALHKNGDKLDNRILNLYWGTPLQNSADSKRHGTWVHGTRVNTAKLNEELVRYVLASRASHTELARELNVSIGAIWHIRDGRTWKHVER